jgi:predicted anti-sigma-YlaC factor YlaD
MTNGDHERALELIMRRGTEEIAARDAEWLEAHLGACAECNDYAEAFASAARLMRASTVMASSALVASTQMRLRTRAHQLEEQRARVVLIALSFCLGALSSAVSAWLWWRFGSWVAERLGVSQAIVQPGIMVFLLLPALVIAGLMLAFPHPIVEGRWISAWTGEREGGTR